MRGGATALHAVAAAIEPTSQLLQGTRAFELGNSVHHGSGRDIYAQHGGNDQLHAGQRVARGQAGAKVKLGRDALGRVLDGPGDVIDHAALQLRRGATAR